MYYRKLRYIIMAAMAVLFLGWTAQSQAQEPELALPKNSLIGTWKVTGDEVTVIGTASPTISPFPADILEVTSVTSNLLEGNLISSAGEISTPVVGVIGRANQLKLAWGDSSSGFVAVDGFLVNKNKIVGIFTSTSSTGVGAGHFNAVKDKKKKK